MKNVRQITTLAAAALLGVAILLANAPGEAHSPATGPASRPAEIRVYFSPRGGCLAAVVEAVDGAKQSIDVQAYSFTHPAIGSALIAAHKRGVRVRVILDAGQKLDPHSQRSAVAAAGIPVWIDAKHAIAHNKIMIVDSATVLTGSFNFSRQAEEANAENLVVIHNLDLAGAYEANWVIHQKHSERQKKL